MNGQKACHGAYLLAKADERNCAGCKDAKQCAYDSEEINRNGWAKLVTKSDTLRRELDLRTLMLLSALESWAYSVGKALPKFMEDELEAICEALKQEVLK